jgi:hypothetical protein
VAKSKGIRMLEMEPVPCPMLCVACKKLVVCTTSIYCRECWEVVYENGIDALKQMG